MGKTIITRSDFVQWLKEFARQIIEQHETLSDLDAASGDADHGSNMERGMSSLLQIIGEWDSHEMPGQFLKNVGMHVVDSVGGSSGALYGTVFLRMARVVDKTEVIDLSLLVEAFEGAAQGIVDRGKVTRGDKTMYDSIAPAAEALRTSMETHGQDLQAALTAAKNAAETGRDATAQMVARRGKSSYARERSRGVVDPGAASAALLIAAAADTLGDGRLRRSS